MGYKPNSLEEVRIDGEIGSDPDELKAIADAIVRGCSIRYARITALRALIEAVQYHDGGTFAPPADDRGDNWKPPKDDSPDALTHLAIYGGEIDDDGDYRELDIRVSLTLRTHFSGIAGFDRARFGGVAGFNWASFGGVARFNKARFCGVAWFLGASFGRGVRFDSARFDGDAWFLGASFDGEAGFNVASFGGDAGFSDASFGGDAKFQFAHFSGVAKFDDSKLAGANFSGTDLTGASFHRADVSGININGAKLIGARGLFGKGRAIARTKPIEEYAAQTAIYGWQDDLATWERLRIIGSLRLFGVSYLTVIAIVLYATFAKWYNPLAAHARDSARTMSEIATDAVPIWVNVLSRLPDLPLPTHLGWQLLATLSVAAAATLYAICCPSEVQEQSEVRWTRAMNQPLWEYRSANWSRLLARYLCLLLFLAGVAYSLYYIIWRTIIAIGYLFTGAE